MTTVSTSTLSTEPCWTRRSRWCSHVPLGQLRREADRVLPLLPKKTAPVDAVLLFDGVFMRPELNSAWDLRILVLTTFEEALRRARLRDAASLGSLARVEERFRNRYLRSQAHCFNAIRPDDIADLVVDNEDPERPAWHVRPR